MGISITFGPVCKNPGGISVILCHKGGLYMYLYFVSSVVSMLLWFPNISWDNLVVQHFVGTTHRFLFELCGSLYVQCLDLQPQGKCSFDMSN